ncbi:MAG: aminotransferase class V-fold PLP-dependent enzyme [Candidatus Hodarchaeales archaeon]
MISIPGLETIREKEFPLTEDYIFMNHAAVAPIPISVFSKQQEFDKLKLHGDSKWVLEQLFKDFQQAREKVASFFNAKPNEVAFVHNTSLGLSMVADGFIWHQVMEKGRKEGNIVITDLEYTSNSFTWQIQARRHGLELRVVKSIDGILPLVDFPIDENTLIVAVSHVQFSNGFKLDIKELSRICHEVGSFIAVDGIQSAGCIEVDVKDLDTDFFVAGGYKWLLGPFNSGFMHVKEELLPLVNPAFVGSQSSVDPRNYRHHDFKYSETASKFQPSVVSMTLPFGEAVSFLDSVGIKAVEGRVSYLTGVLTNLIQETGNLTVHRPGTEKNWSGIVKITVSETKPEEVENIVKKLKKEKIIVAFRDGGIRISPHFYNTEEELENLVNKLVEKLN